MRLSVEILDHIFSFLVSHQETLIACSKDSLLSPIVERHLYYKVIVHIGRGQFNSNYVNAFKPNLLSKIVSENPRILRYVRILEIHVEFRSSQSEAHMEVLDEFAKTLLMFPVLECIMLTSPPFLQDWHWPNVFRGALEDRLNLRTLKELHLTGSKDLPFTVLENCKNIEDLSLLGTFEAEGLVGVSTLPHLKSLNLSTRFISSSLLTWLKLHITELQSLKSASASMYELPELFGECSGTLNKLEVDLTDTDCKSRVFLI